MKVLRYLLIFSLVLGCSSSDGSEEASTALFLNSLCGAYEQEVLLADSSQAELVSVSVAGTDRAVINGEVLLKFHGVTSEGVSPFTLEEGINVLRSLLSSGAYLVRAGEPCIFTEEDGGIGILGQLFTPGGVSINELLIQQGFVLPFSDICDPDGLFSCYQSIGVLERLPTQTELGVESVNLSSTCGAVQQGRLVNPVLSAELVSVDVVSPEQIIVTRSTGVESGNSQLIKLHGVTEAGLSSTRRQSGIDFIRAGTALGAYLVVQDLSCSFQFSDGGVGVVGQLYALDGVSINESLLVQGFALPELDVCSGELLDSCYSILADEAPEEIVPMEPVETTTSTTTTTSTGGCNPPQGNFTEVFGENGNLWKAVSDTRGGNLVLLFDSKFCQEFDRCRVFRTNGELEDLTCTKDQFTQTPFSCFTNPDRQTWRADFKCQSAREVYALCTGAGVQVEFIARPGESSQVCSDTR